ncbi:hypothetical protein HY635_00270 [Candidatus Uhrbacteria bacterium]|nr:hypothetical protein [Candidatus Uhrbacteria bacterium]
MRSTSQDEGAAQDVQWLRSAVDVVVVESVADLRRLLHTRRFDAVVFRTRGAQEEARRIRRDDPQQRVVLLSGFPPLDGAADPDGLVWVSRAGIEDPASFSRAVLGS